MLIDLTLQINVKEQFANADSIHAPSGHIGTHFDVMDKTFPLEYARRDGLVFDVSEITDREIGIGDIRLDEIKEQMFIGFYTGFIEQHVYGTREYHSMHPQLSADLIDALLEKQISIIGIDFAGVRRGKEHTPMDQHCADHGVFIVENMCGMKEAVGRSVIYTFPMKWKGVSGLPCRVIAEK